MENLLDLPHARARALLDLGTPVYLSINPVEYHGPHLSLRNDALVCAGLIRDIHERLARDHPDRPLLLAGELGVGVDPVPGPGSRPVPYRTVRALVEQACRTLADLGARRVVLMTFHGGPLHGVAVQRGVDLLERRGVRAVAPFPLLFREILRGDTSQLAEAYAEVPDAREREALRSDSFHELHAGFGETSLAMHYAAGSVGEVRGLGPCPEVVADPALSRIAASARLAGLRERAAELAVLARGKAWFALRPFPGYTGSPQLATARAGAVFARVIADAFAAVIRDVLAGRARSPLPPFSWLAPATLDGLIPLAPA